MPEIAVGVVTYKGSSRANHLFHTLGRCTPRQDLDWATVFVDDGSPGGGGKNTVEDSREEARLWKETLRLTYVEHGVNRGISAAWNSASRALDCKYVVLINDDVMVVPRWLHSIKYALDHNPQVGVVGEGWHAFTEDQVEELIDRPLEATPRDPGSKHHDPSRRRHEENNPGRVMAPTGCLFGFRRADFDAIGGFDETYKSFYEEVDFGTAMAAKLGKIGLMLSWPYIWHMWSATFNSSPELQAEQRRLASHEHYCNKWNIPGQFRSSNGSPNPFDYTNPKHLGAIGDVRVKWLRKDGSEASGTLRRDCAYISD